jgi:hypothetical protein
MMKLIDHNCDNYSKCPITVKETVNFYAHLLLNENLYIITVVILRFS